MSEQSTPTCGLCGRPITVHAPSEAAIPSPSVEDHIFPDGVPIETLRQFLNAFPSPENVLAFEAAVRRDEQQVTADRVMRAESWAGHYESALKEIIALPQSRVPYTPMPVNEFGAHVRRIARAALAHEEK